MRRLVRLLAVGLALWGLALPASAQVRHVDWSIYTVEHATGRAPTYAEAVLAAKRAAVEACALTLFLPTPSERERFAQRQETLLAALDELVESATLLDKDRQGAQVVVELAVTVRRAPLRERLVRAGLISSLERQRAPRVLVVLDALSRDRPLARFAVARIQDYLAQQAADCVDAEVLQGLLDDDRALSGATAASAEVALRSQADLLVLVSAEVRPTRQFGAHTLYQAVVALEARVPFASQSVALPPTRSRELTFAAVDRDKAQRAAIEEAVGGAIEPLMLELERQWRAAGALGYWYRVRLRGGGDRLVEQLARALGGKATVLERTRSPLEAAFLVRVPGEPGDLVEAIAAQLGPQVRVESESLTETVLRAR